jgi:hypothetical protein
LTKPWSTTRAARKVLPLAKSAYTPRDVLGSSAMHRLLTGAA